MHVWQVCGCALAVTLMLGAGRQERQGLLMIGWGAPPARFPSPPGALRARPNIINVQNVREQTLQ